MNGIRGSLPFQQKINFTISRGVDGGQGHGWEWRQNIMISLGRTAWGRGRAATNDVIFFIYQPTPPHREGGRFCCQRTTQRSIYPSEIEPWGVGWSSKNKLLADMLWSSRINFLNSSSYSGWEWGSEMG